MKKVVLALAFLSTFICGYGQIKNFAGSYIDLYKGHVLTIKPKDIQLQEYGYRDFYLKATTSMESKGILMPKKELGKYASASEYKALVYRRFICEGAFKDSTDQSYPQQYYWLKLKNDTLGISYYRYDAKYEHNFPFEVDSILTVSQERLCSEIKINKDKFEGHDKFYTPTEHPINIVKVKYDSTYRYYINLSHITSTPTFTKGIIILFNDGTKLNYPEAKVETSVRGTGSGYYSISSFIQIKEVDIPTFREKEMTDARIYVTEMKIKDGWRYRMYMNCLYEKK